MLVLERRRERLRLKYRLSICGHCFHFPFLRDSIRRVLASTLIALFNHENRDVEYIILMCMIFLERKQKGPTYLASILWRPHTPPATPSPVFTPPPEVNPTAANTPGGSRCLVGG